MQTKRGNRRYVLVSCSPADQRRLVGRRASTLGGQRSHDLRTQDFTRRVPLLRRGASFCTWRARAPSASDWSDSLTKRCVGETHSISSSLASPPGGRGEEGAGERGGVNAGQQREGNCSNRWHFFYLWESFKKKKFWSTLILCL